MRKITVPLADGRSLHVDVTGLGRGAELTSTDDRLLLKIDRVSANKPFAVALSVEGAGGGLVALRKSRPLDLRKFTKGGPTHWGAPLETQGKKGTEDGPYVVDTLPEPFWWN